jgi:hypothetical protein
MGKVHIDALDLPGCGQWIADDFQEILYNLRVTRSEGMNSLLMHRGRNGRKNVQLEIRAFKGHRSLPNQSFNHLQCRQSGF